MSKMDTLVLKNKLCEIGRLGKFLKDFGDTHHLNIRLVFHLDLILDELVTNIISYGYKDNNSHNITIEMKLNSTQLEVELIDDGIPFNPLKSKKPDTTLNIEDRPIGGLGIHFAKTFTDQLSYKRKNEQNHLYLRFSLEPPISP